MDKIEAVIAGIEKDKEMVIMELAEKYIQMALDELQLKSEKQPVQYVTIPQKIRVELVEDIREGILKNSKETAPFNCHALVIARDKLNEAERVNADIRFGKFFTRDPKLSFATRLVCKFMISKPKEKN